MTTPHVTIEQISAIQPELAITTVVAECNRCNALIDAYNKTNEQPLISAEEARKLGAGKAEFQYNDGKWRVCDKWCIYNDTENFKYRAIQAQPEPVDEQLYCMVSKDGEPAIRMLRTEAQLSDLDKLKLDIENALKAIAEYDQENTDLKAQLAAVQKDAAWQPIETAPKDHFPRLFRVNGYAVQGFVDVTYEHWVQQNGRPPHKMIGNPTHWMPLPKPPIAIKELLT